MIVQRLRDSTPAWERRLLQPRHFGLQGRGVVRGAANLLHILDHRLELVRLLSSSLSMPVRERASRSACRSSSQRASAVRPSPPPARTAPESLRLTPRRSLRRRPNRGATLSQTQADVSLIVENHHARGGSACGISYQQKTVKATIPRDPKGYPCMCIRMTINLALLIPRQGICDTCIRMDASMRAKAKEQSRKRLARIEGQVRGIARMVEGDRIASTWCAKSRRPGPLSAPSKESSWTITYAPASSCTVVRRPDERRAKVEEWSRFSEAPMMIRLLAGPLKMRWAD